MMIFLVMIFFISVMFAILIRKEKFYLILPGAMRDNDFDIWIHVIRDGIPDPLALDLGGTAGYFVFTDRGGDRIERAVFGGRGSAMMERDVYDVYGREEDLRPYVEERNPEKIAVNTSAWIPASDGLSHSGYRKLVDMLGERRLAAEVSGESHHRFQGEAGPKREHCVRKCSRKASPDSGNGIVKRGYHSRRNDTRRCRLVGPGPAPRTGARIVVRAQQSERNLFVGFRALGDAIPRLHLSTRRFFVV